MWKRLEDDKPKIGEEVIICTNNGVKHLLFVGEQKWRDLTECDTSRLGASFIIARHWAMRSLLRNSKEIK